MCKEFLSRLSKTAVNVLDFLSPPFGSPDAMDGVITPIEMLPGGIKYAPPDKLESDGASQSPPEKLEPGK